MVLDFSRSSPACAGPVNISRSTTIAACYVALKHIFGDVPANAGVLEPVEFRIDEDSLLSVKAPKPVGGLIDGQPDPKIGQSIRQDWDWKIWRPGSSSALMFRIFRDMVTPQGSPESTYQHYNRSRKTLLPQDCRPRDPKKSAKKFLTIIIMPTRHALARTQLVTPRIISIITLLFRSSNKKP